MSLGVLIAVCVVIALLNAEFVKDLFSVFASSGFDLGRAGVWKDSIAFFLENPFSVSALYITRKYSRRPYPIFG